MSRFLLVAVVLLATAGAVVAYGDPGQIARARQHRLGIAAQAGVGARGADFARAGR